LSCNHENLSTQHMRRVTDPVTQEIVAEAIVRVCLDCGHTAGTLRNGSLFEPRRPTTFACPAEDFGKTCQKIIESWG